MKSSHRPVVVKRMPEGMSLKPAREFLKEVEPFLFSDRPQLVFDMSQVRHMDAAGVDVLLQCMREVMKRDGDLKLAAPSPAVSVVLELTRTGRLFEIYENSSSAVKSFSCFLPNAIRHLDPGPGDGMNQPVAFEPPPEKQGDEDVDGGRLAA